MENQNEPTCCCGCFGLRNGTRIIATCYLIIGFIITVLEIISFTTIKLVSHIQYLDDSKNSKSENPTLYMLLQFNISMNILTGIFMGIISTYLNFCLRKATFERNVDSIRFWLFINGLSIIYFWTSTVVMAIIIPQSIVIIVIKFIFSLFFVYLIIVVYRFYRKELADTANIDIQPYVKEFQNIQP